jgi:carbonic anhydrase
MHRRQVLKLLGGLACCSLCGTKVLAAEAAHAPHWSYTGDDGPAKWGDLDPANKVCSVGAVQSPIDIGETIRATLPGLRLRWARRADTIVNNGHTIQVNFGDGSTLTGPGGAYKLVQFHLHRPSEHQINGKTYPMEVHFVHANPAGGLAVIGVLMENGAPNAVFNKIVTTMPAAAGAPVRADAAINPNGLLPRRLNYYRYSGSLTTPPCSETVDWLLLTDPIQAAANDVAAFAKLYENNARPVQTINRRFVLRSN